MLRESKIQREIFHWKEWNFLYKDYHCQRVAIAFFFHGTPRGAACISWVPESNLRIGELIETPKNQSAMTSSPKKWSNWETQILFSTDNFGKFKQPVGVCPLPTLPGDFQTKLLPWATARRVRNAAATAASSATSCSRVVEFRDRRPMEFRPFSRRSLASCEENPPWD